MRLRTLLAELKDMAAEISQDTFLTAVQTALDGHERAAPTLVVQSGSMRLSSGSPATGCCNSQNFSRMATESMASSVELACLSSNGHK